MNTVIKNMFRLLTMLNQRNVEILKKINESLDEALDDANEAAQRVMYEDRNKSNKKENK